MKPKSNLILTLTWYLVGFYRRHNFGKDKAKSILFNSKYIVKKASPLNLQPKDEIVKQYWKVTYLGWSNF